MSCHDGVLQVEYSLAFRNFFKRPKGFVVPMHEHHNYDHVLELYHGAIRLEATRSNGDLVDRVYRSEDGIPVRIQIDKGVKHRVTVEADNTSFSCAFSHRFYTGEVSEKFEGNGEAYR